MSNPPIGNPLYYSDDDDFCFPIEAPNYYGIENQPIIIGDDQIMVDEDCMPPSSSSSLPNTGYLNLSMFLDDEQDLSLKTGQLNSGNYKETQESNPSDEQAQVVVDYGATIPVLRPEMQHDITLTTTTTTRMVDDKVVAIGGGLEVGQGSSSCTKKLKHNAKERVRRMKLNDTFLALRALLPESPRAKKRWSAAYVIDRALEYIPELQKEMEKQTLEKESMLSVIRNKQAISAEDDQHVLPKQVHNNSTTLSVSINQVKDGEVIIQICQDKDKVGVLTTLFDRLEAQGVMVLGASSLCASQHRSCFHIHIQMSKKPRELDYIENLHQKIISWLS